MITKKLIAISVVALMAIPASLSAAQPDPYACPYLVELTALSDRAICTYSLGFETRGGWWSPADQASPITEIIWKASTDFGTLIRDMKYAEGVTRFDLDGDFHAYLDACIIEAGETDCDFDSEISPIWLSYPLTAEEAASCAFLIKQVAYKDLNSVDSCE
jgi:hypothetical protein